MRDVCFSCGHEGDDFAPAHWFPMMWLSRERSKVSSGVRHNLPDRSWDADMLDLTVKHVVGQERKGGKGRTRLGCRLRGRSSVGRALASQARCRGFESHRPLSRLAGLSPLARACPEQVPRRDRPAVGELTGAEVAAGAVVQADPGEGELHLGIVTALRAALEIAVRDGFSLLDCGK